MARLSPSPSGSSSRRLSELLEEQQEPFSLDLYLLEKGCPPTLLDAAGGGATSTCWPRSNNASPALRRPAASKRTRASGLLRLLLSKILRGTAAAKKKKKLQQPAAIDWGAVDGEKQKPPGHLKNGAELSPSPRRLDDAVEADMEMEEEDDDDESSKQLSPVSVLEQRPFEKAPPAYAQKAMAIFKELLVAAYTPALLDQLAKDSSGGNRSKDCRNDTTPAPAPEPARADRTTSAAHWEELFEAELAKVHSLIASEMAGARVGPDVVLPERWEVGADVAAAVLDALTEEVAVELMGMDHDDAIDDGRWCWC